MTLTGGPKVTLRITLLTLIALLSGIPSGAQYVGAEACRECHAARVEAQSTTGHARALRKAEPGGRGQWAFGAGEKATTWVSQTDRDTYSEHGLSYFASTKSMGLTPGHDTPQDIRYRTLDPQATTLRCFRCHSTGPISLDENHAIGPSEPGVRCESCHGPGGAHVAARGRPGTILNPAGLSAVEMNQLCGACHRNAPESDWTDKWKTRHQPSYLAQAACFRNSRGALSCVTCHDPHGPLNRVSAQYDKRCMECHKTVRHTAAVAADTSCASCHMPQVTINAQLKFTNHWIGIYAKGSKLVPSRSVSKSAPPVAPSAGGVAAPADAASLRPLFEQAVAEAERLYGAEDPRAAQSVADLGLFLVQIGDPAAAEPFLRRALQLNRAQMRHVAETLAETLAESGRSAEALTLFRQAAMDTDGAVRSRALANLAQMEPARAEEYYRGAIEAEGSDNARTGILLNNLAIALEQKKDFKGAEMSLRRALVIQRKIAGPDSPAEASTLSNLGSLLETGGRHVEAERLAREAVRVFELKLGPRSAELATGCTNLADILWTKGDRAGAAGLYQRAVSIDESVYGLDSVEVAGDLFNYGTLLKEMGQTRAARAGLERALAIYERTSGTASPQARRIQDLLR